MKNSKRILTLLVFMPLLAGCGNNVSKPKFAKFSNEVKTYEKFNEELQKALKKTSLFKTAKLGSIVFSGDNAYKDVFEIKREEKAVHTQTEYNSSKATVKYDAANLIYNQNLEQKLDAEYIDKSGAETYSSKEITNYQVQVKDSKNLATVFPDKKEYQVESFGGQKAADYFDNLVKPMFAYSYYSNMGQILGMYEEGTKSCFKFYNDGDIFTVVYSRETKDSSDETYKYESKYEYTVQLEIKEGKWSSKSYSLFESTKTYKVNSYAMAKGDVQIEKEEEASTRFIEAKEPNLKNISLDKYSEAPKVE